MDMREINEGVISEFRGAGGQLSGPMAGAPILLLTTIGRRTGNPHTNPLGFIDVGGRLVVAGANGGADRHPDWYLNIERSDSVTVEVPGASIPATATIVSGDERVELLDRLAATLPGMADHIAGTDREIPVVVFSES